MPLPDKLFSYNQSILSRMPVILEYLEKENMNVKDLYSKTKSSFESISEFQETLDAIFALGKIKLTKSEVLEYVG